MRAAPTIIELYTCTELFATAAVLVGTQPTKLPNPVTASGCIKFQVLLTDLLYFHVIIIICWKFRDWYA